MPETRLASHSRGERLALLGVMALAIGVYANALANGFAGDDVYIVQQNPVVHGFGRWRPLLLGSYWPGSDELYRPAVLVSFAAVWSLFGGAAWSFHALTVLGHAAVTGLVFTLTRRLGGSLPAAALGAAVFAVHPVHVEAVATVVGWSEVLATVLVLAACHLQLRPGDAGWGRRAGIVACYFAALCAKEIAVTLPALLLLLELRRTAAGPREGGAVLRRMAPTLAPLAAALALYLALRRAAIGDGLGTHQAPVFLGVPTADRLATAARLVPEYLRLLFWPRELSSDWSPATLSVTSWTDPLAWAGLLAAAGLLGLAIRCWRREGWWPFAILWFAVAILPVSQLFFPVGVLLAERTLYLPSVALALLAPPLAALLRSAAQPRIALAGVTAVLAVAAARTWSRTPSWKDQQSLVATLAHEHPEAWRVQVHLADALARVGRHDESIARLHRADSLTRGNAVMVKRKLTARLLEVGRAAEAEGPARESVRLTPADPGGWLQLAATRIALAEPARALAALDSLRRIRPRDAWLTQPVARLRTLAYLQLGRADSALAWSDTVLRLDPAHGDAAVWLARARAHYQAGRPALTDAALDSLGVRAGAEGARQARALVTDPAGEVLRRRFMAGDLKPTLEAVLR